MTDAAADAALIRRRNVRTAAVLLVLAAAALWGASRLPWATLTAQDGLSPARDFTVHGSDWSPWLTPVAIVLVAAVAATVALKGWALRLTALVVAVIGIVSVLPVISLLTGDDPGAYAARSIDLAGRYQVASVDTRPWVAIVVVLGAVLAVSAATVLLRVARGATSMSSRYRSPAARRAELEETVFAERAAAERQDPSATTTGDAPADPSEQVTERMLWDALDTGADPTDPATTRTAAPDGRPDDDPPRDATAR
ncbi:MAG: TIGR02234 family membrane protein [Williamsia herbipolensis]|nr:TIGR02234 family membrane protein [Williamsia herbipolensis]